jgi:hypothetical protein
MSVKIDFDNSNKFVKQLKKDIPDAVRFAASFTLNDLAYSGVKKAERQIKKKMTLRNKHTVGNKPASRGVKFNRSKPRRDMSLQFSEFGATTEYDYLKEQNDGFKHKGIQPLDKSRTGNSHHRTLRKKNYLRAMSVKSLKDYRGPGTTKGLRGIFSKTNKNSVRRWRALLFLAYRKGYGLPGSSQFFYIEKNSYHGFNEGYFQFASKSPKKKKFAYPHLKKFFHGKGVKNTARYGQKWMDAALKKFTQAEINKSFADNSKKQLKKHGLI